MENPCLKCPISESCTSICKLALPWWKSQVNTKPINSTNRSSRSQSQSSERPRQSEGQLNHSTVSFAEIQQTFDNISKTPRERYKDKFCNEDIDIDEFFEYPFTKFIETLEEKSDIDDDFNFEMEIKEFTKALMMDVNNELSTTTSNFINDQKTSIIKSQPAGLHINLLNKRSILKKHSIHLYYQMMSWNKSINILFKKVLDICTLGLLKTIKIIINFI